MRRGGGRSAPQGLVLVGVDSLLNRHSVAVYHQLVERREQGTKFPPLMVSDVHRDAVVAGGDERVAVGLVDAARMARRALERWERCYMPLASAD